MRRIALVVALVAVAVGIALSLWSSPGTPSDPARDQPTKEYRRPSGFWTSTRPATNGAYRYRLLGIGIALIGATGAVMVLLVGRANANRTGRAVMVIPDR
jgi:hypothetical protein